jgi:Zn finger protein HypA/HybF involved in hydrogenase expression
VHEVSLVEALIADCVSRTGGRPVKLVSVRYASSVPEAGLRQAFTMLSRGTTLEGARLEAEPFEVTLACACGFVGALGHDDLVSAAIAVCPACGEVTTLSRTAELELLDLQ